MKINKYIKRSFSFDNIKKYKYLNNISNSKIIMNYLHDPLLKSENLLLENNVLNLYSAIVKIEDFETNRPLNSIPYISLKIFMSLKP